MSISPVAFPSVGSDSCGSEALVPIRSAHRLIRFVLTRPASSTRGAGRTARRRLSACSVGLVPVGFACPLRLRRVWDGDGDCVYRMGAFDCLPVILRLPGNTRAVGVGRHVVGSQSGSIASPPASYPMRLCILSPQLPRPVPSVPFPACLALIASYLLPSIWRDAPFGFPPYLIVHYAPPAVSSKRGGFPKRIEFDAFENVAV